MDPEVLVEIDHLVRGGFDTPDRIVDAICEEIYEPGELDRGDVVVAVRAAVAKHEIAKAEWPSETDNDRLERAFTALNRRGVIALHNAGNTQSDGYGDFLDKLEDTGPAGVNGYCFYHWQDIEHAMDGEGLYLAFGPRDPKDEPEGGVAVGRIVVEELDHVGLATTWNGKFTQRILIDSFEWQRR
jgi:hypothetical protein